MALVTILGLLWVGFARSSYKVPTTGGKVGPTGWASPPAMTDWRISAYFVEKLEFL